ncbi:hypothetical protein [Listeria seeligeri]|uniref:hypothetical protein n=1 Tax=Listeria seeligeri TaxID=1640 RepID=UPI00162AAB30|nr:hypothetical protein [Listeria seeligeri]MBC1817180.1 hypothetical protein [Listeria seeligeri]
MKLTVYINENTNEKLNTIIEEEGFETLGKFLNHFVNNYETHKQSTEKIRQLNQYYAGIKRTTDDHSYKIGVVLDVLNTMMKVEDIYECISIDEEKSTVVAEAMKAADKRREAEKIRAYHLSQTPDTSRESE